MEIIMLGVLRSLRDSTGAVPGIGTLGIRQ